MRKIGQSLLPGPVEQQIFKIHGNNRSYATCVRYIYSWCKALNITPEIFHVVWDDDIWRMGTELDHKWQDVRVKKRPKRITKIVFEKPTLLKCPVCQKNMVNIDFMTQKRGQDEPATIFASCKNPVCRKNLGREHRFRTEG